MQLWLLQLYFRFVRIKKLLTSNDLQLLPPRWLYFWQRPITNEKLRPWEHGGIIVCSQLPSQHFRFRKAWSRGVHCGLWLSSLLRLSGFQEFIFKTSWNKVNIYILPRSCSSNLLIFLLWSEGLRKIEKWSYHTSSCRSGHVLSECNAVHLLGRVKV